MRISGIHPVRENGPWGSDVLPRSHLPPVSNVIMG
jgi:hypothetical protein